MVDNGFVRKGIGAKAGVGLGFGNDLNRKPYFCIICTKLTTVNGAVLQEGKKVANELL